MTNFYDLVQMAVHAKENSYSPYSHFRVGAVAYCDSGKVYYGSNIENASYGLTICAERTAIFKAISEGERSIKSIAVNCDASDFEDAYPCGACRQVMTEFMDDDADVIISISNGAYIVRKVKDLLPHAFRLSK